MRNASDVFNAVERGKNLSPRHKLTMRREHMRRISDLYTIAPGVDVDIPQTYFAVGGVLYSAWRTENGSGYVGFGNSLRQGTLIEDGATPGAMRYGLGLFGGTPSVFRAVSTNGRWKIQRAAIGGDTLSWANFGVEFGNGANDTTDHVRRIENIIVLNDGRLLVAEGIHQFTRGVTYIRFYLLDAWSATTLYNAIEFELSDAYTNWLDVNKSACFIAAGDAVSSTYSIIIIATAHKDGYAVQWTLNNGVESDPMPVLPLDSQSDSARIFPIAITPMNGVLNLTAGVMRQQADQNGTVSQTYYEALLTASPNTPRMWSFGGLDHFLSANYRNGSLVYIAPAGYTGEVWHVGNGSRAVFAPSNIQTNIDGTDLSGRFKNWELRQNEGSADQFTTSLANGDGVLNSDENVIDDGVMYLESGHASVGLIQMGAYRVQLSREIALPGHGSVNVVGQDLARAKLNDTVLPFSGQILGRSSWRSALNTLAGLKLKTANRGFAVSDAGLNYQALNDPLVAEIQARNNGNFLACFTVTAHCDDEFHLASFGIGIGLNDKENTGNVFTISKEHAWTGHLQKNPKLRKFALPDDAWELIERGTTLIEQAGENKKITEDAGAAYTYDSEAMIPVGVKTDIALRVFGEWGVLYKKPNDMRPGVCAANAIYKIASRVRFSRLTPKNYGRNSFCGVVLAQDSYSSKTAFNASAWQDVELSLTNAQLTHGSRAGAYNKSITGTVIGHTEVPGSQHAADVDGIGTHFTTELRVGQSVMMNNRVRVIASIGSDTHMSMTDSINCGGTFQLYIRDSDFYAWATSRHSEQNASGTILYHNPGAVKTTYEIGGRCVFVSNDNTALSIRRVWTDGVDHYLVDSGWDPTNPIPDGSPGSSSSDPNNWRGIFRNSLIAKATAASFGLPDGVSRNRYMIIGGEIVRYVETSFTRFAENLKAIGYAQTETWLEIPVVFGVPETQDTPGSVISPHMSGSPFASVRVGDLLEVTSRNTGGEGYFTYDPDKTIIQRYAAGVTSGNISTGIYDAPYGLLKPVALNVALNERDMVIASGRGAFGTTKSAHNPDTWVSYYPVGSDGALPNVIVHRAGFWSGEFKTMEQGIRKLCGYAGVTNVNFRNAYEDVGATGINYLQFDELGVAMIAGKPVSDFTLHLSAPISSAGRLSLYFRGYYKLDIFQPQAGYVGLRLQTTKTQPEGGVDAYNGERNLCGVDVQISNFPLSNNYPILVSAIGTEVVIQINGQPVWTFDLESFVGDGYDYLRVDADYIYVQQSPLEGVVAARLSELGNEMPETAISPDQPIASAIGNMVQFTNAISRATSSGGVEFTNLWKRDRVGDISGLICTDKYGGLLPGLAGHVLAVGDGASADWIDDGVIAKNGYRFAQIRVGGVSTVEQARKAARLALRNMKEQAFTRNMTGFGLLTAQPGDLIRIGYQMGTGMPALPDTDFVISDLELSADLASVRASWRVREAYE